MTPIHYVGTVWCVKVPTGAFVARRNGKVFVTGNSGFPKSLDVSKAIDKEAGAERADLGVSPNWREKKRTNGQSMNAVPNESRITIPATDAAKQWSGWGTALKPGYESIVMARKPLQLDGEARILAQKVMEAVCRISSASGAGPSSASSQADSLGLKFDSARWGAVRRCSTPGDLFALMGTWPSELEIPSSLSTAFSWLNTLGAVLGHASMFTTETASSLTTDLKTLNSFLSKTTPESMLQHETRPRGTGSSACLADAIFNGVAAKLDYTLASSAAEPATSSGGSQGLRPNFSPIILARKPLRGTVARNVQTFGTGAINVDGCRVGTTKRVPCSIRRAPQNSAYGDLSNATGDTTGFDPNIGRWPANILLDEAAAAALDQMAPQAGASAPVRGDEASAASTGCVTGERDRVPGVFHGDRGGASRFFYTSKASGEDRGRWQGNDHPTVKPTDLMRWLCRLVTPPGGLILDPFMGSGSTGVAAVEEGFRFVGIDLEARHVEIAERRLKHAARQPGLFDGLGS